MAEAPTPKKVTQAGYHAALIAAVIGAYLQGGDTKVTLTDPIVIQRLETLERKVDDPDLRLEARELRREVAALNAKISLLIALDDRRLRLPEVELRRPRVQLKETEQ